MAKRRKIKVKVDKKGVNLLKFLLFLVLFLLILSFVFYTYFYFHFSILVDRAILDKKIRKIPEIFTSPSIVFVGERIGSDYLKNMLLRSGYKFSGSLSYENSFYISKDGDKVYIRNSKIWSKRYPYKVVEIDFGNEGVSRIYDILRKREVKRFYISPEVIGFSKGNFKFKFLKYNELPENLIYAILSAEDKRFFKHSGIDYFGILRAMVKNLMAGRIVQGGSTLTQQIVKNLFLTPERSFKRKFKEAFISNILEGRFSKKELLELYANFVYLGQVNGFEIHGFREAAFVYFGRDLNNLTTSELALLSGMVRSPVKYCPYTHPDFAVNRRNKVLKLMYQNGFISKREYILGEKEKLNLKMVKVSIAPYFADYVSKNLSGNSDVIYSSLNREIQLALERGVKDGYLEILEELHKMGNYQNPQVAGIVINGKNGNILGMVGGLDYFKSQFNRAVYIRRQAGSIIKPFVYLCVVGSGISPDTVVDDHPIVFRYGRRKYTPHNYENIYYGNVDMKKALSKSDNVATVKYAKMVGFKSVSDFINQLGFKNSAVPYPSTALGTIDVSPIEIGRAYTLFLNGGTELDTTFFRGKRKIFRKIASSRSTKIVFEMLKEVIKSGTGRRLKPFLEFLPLAGKTGTSKDGWFVGICKNLIVVIWVGYDENRELGLSGGRSALFIFKNFLINLLKLYPIVG